MRKTQNWFEVDRQGLAALLERRGKAFLVYELLQNAWDEGASETRAELRAAGGGYASLSVEDDCPNGFKRLSDAFTLFAPSDKKGHAEQRGRFNVGEKTVVALCTEARLSTTSGEVRFGHDGRRTLRATRTRGSLFSGRLKLRQDEIQEIETAVARLIPPAQGVTYFNGQRLMRPMPVASIERSLPTELADAEGRLRRSVRKTRMDFYVPAADQAAAIYELGIPVVETGDTYSVDIQQKVPLNLERDNVTPAFLAQVRAYTLEATAARLNTEQVNAVWVKEAMEQHAEDLPDPVVRKVVALRFGNKPVAFDPSDLEANYRAVEQGYTVVHGGQLSAAEWAAARRVQAIPPAGQVTPTPRPFSKGGQPLQYLPRSEWPQAVREVADYAKRLAPELIGISVVVHVANDPHWNSRACFGNGELSLNLGALGETWFGGDLADINALLIHEFAHHIEGNHLAERYHEALCDLGGRLATLALSSPALFLPLSARGGRA